MSRKWRLRAKPGRAVPVRESGQVLADGGAADAEQPGDVADAAAGQGEQVACLADLLTGHRRDRPRRRLQAGGIQALAAAQIVAQPNALLGRYGRRPAAPGVFYDLHEPSAALTALPSPPDSTLI